MVLMLEDISRCWKIEAGKCPADNVSCILCFQKMKNCKLLKAAWDKQGCHFPDGIILTEEKPERSLPAAGFRLSDRRTILKLRLPPAQPSANS